MLEELLTYCRTALEAGPAYDRDFEFEISFADSYDQLLAGELHEPTSDVDQVRARAREAGRLLLAAEAGAGKSTSVQRLVEQAIDHGVPALVVDLGRWTPTIDAKWRDLRDSDLRRMNLLLSQLSRLALSEESLGEAASEAGAIVAVDGLNEVPPSATRSVLWALDSFAARRPWAAVIACDRLQRRDLPSCKWSLATISGISDPTREAEGVGVGEHGPNNALLLDISDDVVDAPTGEAQVLLRHIARRADLSSASLEDLGHAALSVYQQKLGRFFPREALARSVDQTTVESLERGQLLLRDASYAYFRHHLFHDALAACAVVSSPADWTDQTFDDLTFKANSFDAVGLALELVGDPTAADEFLMAVYDWNLYAAAYALGRGRRRGTVAVTADTELAMLAVLAERRWDPVAKSVQRVEDALRVFPSGLAEDLLAADDLDAVIALIERDASRENGVPGWFEIFGGRLAPNQLVARLHEGALAGWMASNVLRRTQLDADSRQAVLLALRGDDKTVRWRAAHVLGSDASDEAVGGLLQTLDDDDWEWARYGAIRALIELAARDELRRADILEAIVDRLDDLRTQPLVLRELVQALELRDPPSGWVTTVAPIVEQLFLSAETVPDQDHWLRVGRRVSTSVQAARAA